MFLFNRIEEALQALQKGEMLVVVDDADRENEGDLVLAAEKATPEAINFMAKHGRGLICVPMTDQRATELKLEPMVNNNTDPHATAFTVSVDAEGTTTGISAQERAYTVKKLIDPLAQPETFRRPGHIFPLRARSGGVLRRAGHTEAAVDLARLAGLYPAGVICEIMNEDGSMARVPELMTFVQEYNLKIVTIADLIRFRSTNEKLVQMVGKAKLPTRYGEFTVYGYESMFEEKAHLALVKGNLQAVDAPIVRVHSECLTGDVFGSLRCDCGCQIGVALKAIEREGAGVLLYMRQEGRGIGLLNKIKAYELQDGGQDTVEANAALGFPPDLRDYGLGAQILSDIGLTKIRLMTNNPRKIAGLEGHGLKVMQRIPLEIAPGPQNGFYLKTKKTKLGHLLSKTD